jgi:hypothetical protein
MRGVGRAVFAAILLLIAGTLNIIYGIAAISDAHFFTDAGNHYVFSNINTWGWITVILGVIELTAGFSLMGGGSYGRVVGIAAATIGAIGALLSIGGAYPFWSLGIFALCIIVIHGLVVYGEPEVDASVRR